MESNLTCEFNFWQGI